ncbi:MAG TPA: ADP-forming succinate--CoA ligase subunit beta [Ignavibacteriales bacterium]|nr:ADP-forming succinate--CoA ligase subunit beta [Ignavibacteriales bacterium]HOL80752.1 ADP-forming succinate--CoA ligase subunit beta [Ignavibacteriales bacterium]HOM65999.1 ADP-forming succinate--CoA ligase subunit beta [Ignavibacteriales bacterium]HPD67767.1 ADP-forming succinate--CoA ligase subunit beta [Ignavibacteriales bacterium]HPP33188.1 ADP-forming succinate--CoA ligase subunit beta [Ignavibacteriales bacterium]
MKIHEYQAKELFKNYNIPTQLGILATTVEEAEEAAKKIGGNFFVLKAQIHAGGRGKAGGVQFAKSIEEVKQKASAMLGKEISTYQSGGEAKRINKIFIVPGADIQKEYYVALTFDRESKKNVFIVSSEGGVEIEKLAVEQPDKITKLYVDPLLGFNPFQARKLAFALGFKDVAFKQAISLFTQLYKLYEDLDANLVEINPLITQPDNTLLALDAKINFDDNALFRHPEILSLRDKSEEDPFELEASENNLNYVKLDGNVGCMVNGAGLAMATMDIIKLAGGNPANFLDVGGGANKDTVAKGFKIIMKDPNVKAILVNIFGGIVRCDRVANGIIEASKEVKPNIPIIVRLEGTNSVEAGELLRNSGIDFVVATTLDDAAQKVKEVVG